MSFRQLRNSKPTGSLDTEFDGLGIAGRDFERPLHDALPRLTAHVIEARCQQAPGRALLRAPNECTRGIEHLPELPGEGPSLSVAHSELDVSSHNIERNASVVAGRQI